jgi:hypothetical protein
MKKENGMLEQSKNLELSNKKGKLFVCNICGHKEKVRNIIFGSSILCKKCGEIMEEAIDK